jgi:acetyl esterase
MTKALEGKIAPVTGGAQRIGAAMRTKADGIWRPLGQQRELAMSRIFNFASTILIGASIMTTPASAQIDAATDPNIDAPVRALLAELNKDPSPFWELSQPKPQDIITGLQNKTPVDMSGVKTVERTITEGGRSVKIHIMTPEHVTGKPGVLLFIHGGVWIVGNFDNHKRLLRDLVVGSGQVGVFVEYTPLPAAKYPTQPEESYSVLKWIAAHAGEFGADGSRIAVAGNSVGGNMSAALTLMTKDRNGPKISYQVLFVPATNAGVDTQSYKDFATGRFLARAFMKYGWDLYAPDEKTRNLSYVSPLRASLEQLKDLPPALVITAENDPLRDEGEAYARRLKEAGVSVDSVRYNGTIHDFMFINALRDLPSTQAAIRQASEGIQAHIGQ